MENMEIQHKMCIPNALFNTKIIYFISKDAHLQYGLLHNV